MKTISKFSILLGALVAFQACSMKGSKPEINQGSAKLEAKSGSKVAGTLYVEDHFGGVVISGKVTGLKPKAKHGMHIHETGDCSAADASTAGNHYAKPGQAHGALGGVNVHTGDLGNIQTDKTGAAEVNIFLKEANMKKKDAQSLVGRSIVIHESADDLKSQPAGNSGKRIACGVIEWTGTSKFMGGCEKDSSCGKCESCKKGDMKNCQCPDGKCKCDKDCKGKDMGCMKGDMKNCKCPDGKCMCSKGSKGKDMNCMNGDCAMKNMKMKGAAHSDTMKH